MYVSCCYYDNDIEIIVTIAINIILYSLKLLKSVNTS